MSKKKWLILPELGFLYRADFSHYDILQPVMKLLRRMTKKNWAESSVVDPDDFWPNPDPDPT